MKIRIILTGRGGELDRQTIDSERNVSDSIMQALKVWSLDVGDTITIEEVETE